MITAATQTKDQVLRNSILHSKVSRHIHEQGKTLFCWAFAISSMIRQSLIMSLENFTACDPTILNFALENLKQNAFHKKLRNELIMLPIPKINGDRKRSANDTHYLERAVERVSFCVNENFFNMIFKLVFKSSMAPEGIFMLNAFNEILEMVGCKSVTLNEDFTIFDVDGEDGLKQAIKNKKCPVINVTNRRTNEVGILKKLESNKHVIYYFEKFHN